MTTNRKKNKDKGNTNESVNNKRDRKKRKTTESISNGEEMEYDINKTKQGTQW